MNEESVSRVSDEGTVISSLSLLIENGILSSYHLSPLSLPVLRSVPYASYPYPSETYERSEEQTSGERDGKRSSLAPVSDGR